MFNDGNTDKEGVNTAKRRQQLEGTVHLLKLSSDLVTLARRDAGKVGTIVQDQEQQLAMDLAKCFGGNKVRHSITVQTSAADQESINDGQDESIHGQEILKDVVMTTLEGNGKKSNHCDHPSGGDVKEKRRTRSSCASNFEVLEPIHEKQVKASEDVSKSTPKGRPRGRPKKSLFTNSRRKRKGVFNGRESAINKLPTTSTCPDVHFQ